MERTVAGLYRAAADGVTNPDLAHLLRDLASMEEGHTESFTKILAELDRQAEEDRTVPEPASIAGSIRGWVSSFVHHSSERMERLVETAQSPADILEEAIALEKDAVAFYTGIRECLAPKDQDVINSIIQEEMGHIAALGNALRDLK